MNSKGGSISFLYLVEFSLGRVINSGRMKIIRPESDAPAQRALELHRSAMEVHEHCLAWVSASFSVSSTDPERMALVLAAAQSAHSLAALCLQGSELLGRMAHACAEVLDLCEENCRIAKPGTGRVELERCAEACRRCRELCLSFQVFHA